MDEVSMPFFCSVPMGGNAFGVLDELVKIVDEGLKCAMPNSKNIYIVGFCIGFDKRL
jgi:hypothetical protein